MPKITIDGKVIEAKAGETVIKAAEDAGIFIPRYCYHPGLSIAGNCRMCLVEVEKSPKLQISCNTQVQEGMVVRTKSDPVKEAQKNVLEFLLANHPLDCPVCDQSGECDLQNFYMAYGQYDPRFVENKVKKAKAKPLGPTVMLDAERCVLCSRCVRFTDEITETHEFGIFNRGDHSEVGLGPGKILDNKYSGNVVDICPVGALTDKDFRFKLRVWYLKETESVCNGCSRGCNIEIHTNRTRRKHHAEGERVARLKPRTNLDVNEWWICDEGRYGYMPIDHNRITEPTRKVNGVATGVPWDTALLEIANQWKAIVDKHGPDAVAVLPSPQLTTEDLFMIKKVFGGLGVKRFESDLPGQEGFEDDFLIRADKNPNTMATKILGLIGPSMEKILDDAAQGRIKALYIFGHNLTKAFAPEKVRKALSSCEMVVFQGQNKNPMTEMAHFVLPSASYAEKDGTFINFQGRIQLINKALDPLDESRVDWEIVQRLAQEWGQDHPFRFADQIFDAMAKEVSAFANLSHEKIGNQGVLLSLDKEKVKV